MKEYTINDNGKEYKMYYIGANHNAEGIIMSGVISSYHEPFDNLDVVNVENGFGGIRHGIIGDIKEAYAYLKDELVSKTPRDLYEYSECVQSVVLKYFGDFTNIYNHLAYYPLDEEINLSNKEIGKVSNLKNKSAAKSVERAMLSQNLLCEIGFDTTFKISGAIVNGKETIHAFNLIRHDGKYYIFDSTMPTMCDGITSPIICEIPRIVYEKMISPFNNIGYSVDISHYCPLQEAECEITYDAGRKELYKASEYTKKKVMNANI